jgi:hypothetical protein
MADKKQPLRETLEQAEVKLIEVRGEKPNRDLIVQNQSAGSQRIEATFEYWFENDGHASYGLLYDGVVFEFARSGKTVAELEV